MHHEKNIEEYRDETPLAPCRHRATHVRLENGIEFACARCARIYASSGFMPLHMRHLKKALRLY